MILCYAEGWGTLGTVQIRLVLSGRKSVALAVQVTASLQVRSQSLSDSILVCFLLSWALPWVAFFLSPSMTCKVCLFRQLVSPLKIILFYATHNETCLSVKKHTCAFLCPASRQPIRYFSDEQLDVGLQTNIPFFRERLSYVGIAVVWAWLGTLVAFHPVASACCISGNFFGC